VTTGTYASTNDQWASKIVTNLTVSSVRFSSMQLRRYVLRGGKKPHPYSPAGEGLNSGASCYV